MASVQRCFKISKKTSQNLEYVFYIHAMLSEICNRVWMDLLCTCEVGVREGRRDGCRVG